ncbi:LysR family transcriptional regulator [Labrys wisconsinensis]|uniref:DNA-binding transcriptional LysR family regulator n=1 Tax=Labrys wisconsinensis TaxID=425677 RepID=A0ABU0JL69_9HYPH|nr:LysR family transcriptional regulator [Labrys wisconsinensis]MDQ0475041.1 DNA-binding transcriptional LysR family regulator [Labrys wisconsinensis]
MSRSTPSWDLFGTFLAVMREGSLSAAARALGTAQPTVRRQVETLEHALGAVLFTRSPTGLVPTETARRTLPYAQEMAATAEAFVRSLDGPGGAGTGTVRLTCSEVVGIEVLPPILAALLARHPGLDIELVPTDRTEDLLRRDADIAVRMTQPTQAALVARSVGAIQVGFYAAPAYLADRPEPHGFADLADHVLIGDDRSGVIARGLAAVGLAGVRLHFAYRCDSNLAQLAAIRAGVGIGICQTALARRSGLTPVLPALRFPLPTWLVMHEDLRTVPRVRIVFDHLVEALGAYAAGRTGGHEPPAA